MTLPTSALYTVQLAATPIIALSLAQEAQVAVWGPGGWVIVIAAIFLGIAQVIAAWAAAKKAIAPVAAKVDVIEGHVNSEKAIDKGVIASQQLQIALQRETIEGLNRATALLAQAKAIADTSAAIAQAATAGATTPPVAAAASLSNIDQNTAATVQELKNAQP